MVLTTEMRKDCGHYNGCRFSIWRQQTSSSNTMNMPRTHHTPPQPPTNAGNHLHLLLLVQEGPRLLIVWIWRPKQPRRGRHTPLHDFNKACRKYQTCQKPNWLKKKNDVSTKNYFDERLTESNKEGAITYSSFFENVMSAAKDTATTIKRPTTGWFEENKELLKPPIKEKHSLQAKWRSATGDLKVSLLKKLRAATKVVKDKVAIAKEN